MLIVFGLEATGTTRYADLPVVHSERKFQSHPAVPPARLIDLRKTLLATAAVTAAAAAAAAPAAAAPAAAVAAPYVGDI